MAAPAPPAQEKKGLLGDLADTLSGAAQSMSDAVGLKKDELTPSGVEPEKPGYTGTGGRRRKTRGGKRRSTRKTTRRHRKAKKSRKH